LWDFDFFYMVKEVVEQKFSTHRALTQMEDQAELPQLWHLADTQTHH